MIRHAQDGQWLLVTQHDHALLSGRLAEHIGNDRFARPAARAVLGISLHDCGWPLHDDNPTLNGKGEPLHVFEAPVWVAGQVWPASARRAANRDPYAGLLVSIHVMHLATMAAQTHRSPRDVFEINKFQHQQVEFQEGLRRSLGMRTDIPLNHGLAKAGLDPREDELAFDYRLLRAMDQLSLALLCADDLFPTLAGVEARPGTEAMGLRLTRPASFHVRLNPWPFDESRIALSVPCRRLAAAPFRDLETFRSEYAQVAAQAIQVTVEADE